jgi:hypothetical protein
VVRQNNRVDARLGGEHGVEARLDAFDDDLHRGLLFKPRDIAPV